MSPTRAHGKRKRFAMNSPTVLITGANRGIGLAFVEAHLNVGFSVFAGCRKPSESEALRELASAHPGRLDVIGLDVTNESSIEVHYRTELSRGGGGTEKATSIESPCVSRSSSNVIPN